MGEKIIQCRECYLLRKFGQEWRTRAENAENRIKDLTSINDSLQRYITNLETVLNYNQTKRL